MDEHLTDNKLVSLFGRELTLLQRHIARRHLSRCQACRTRQLELQGWRTDRVFEDYRAAKSRAGLTLREGPRAEFTQWLKREVRQAAPQRPHWTLRWANLFMPHISGMTPLLTSGIVLVATGVFLLFAVWWQQRVPNINSNDLLAHAERWDRPQSSSSTGVVYQAVRITARKHSMERSIYRDAQRIRRPKRVTLTGQNEQIKTALDQAGVDWNEPLSASLYQEWHDRQCDREDQISRAGAHLLRLTTEVPDGSISEQSLTVRDTDFHPVQRTVVFRDRDTIEIAELDFKVLPWRSVDESVFEPLGGLNTAGGGFSPRVLMFPRAPERLTESQLDETELSARLILNKLHADTGEQIEIARTAQKVEVKGLVETSQRKRELQLQLAMVPHLMVSIRSVQEERDLPGSDSGISSIKVASMPEMESPLETYLLTRGRSVREIGTLQQELFDAVLTISQESKAINDLRERFARNEQTSILASATLAQLAYNHHERLDAALRRERELLSKVQAAGANQDHASQSSSLLDFAIKNLTLCKELTQTNGPAARSAEAILTEMSVTLGSLSDAAHKAYEQPVVNSALSGKK
jgi:hypothetical protein